MDIYKWLVGDCNKYSTTHIEPQTSTLPDLKATQETRTTQPSVRMNSDSCIGNLIGAVIGGALLGATITAIIFVFIYRKSSIFQKVNQNLTLY